MPGLAHDQAHRLAAAYADELVVHIEGLGPLRRLVGIRIVGGDALDEEVLGVAVGGREAPGDVLVVDEQEEGNAGGRRADQREARGLEARQEPSARSLASGRA